MRRDWAPICAKAALTRDATGVYRDIHSARGRLREYKVAEGSKGYLPTARRSSRGANVAYSLEETAVTASATATRLTACGIFVSDQMVTLPGSFKRT